MKIIKRETVSENAAAKISKLEVASPDIARKAKPGQFVVLMASEKGERVPLTIVDTDSK